MGKASSNKKVARAAKAGGSRARAAGERNLVFPAALFIVVLLGTLLVVYARDNRSSEALEAPLLSDHWHSAYGFYACDDFLPELPEYVAPQNGGNHTHGDGLIHIHPFSSARAGENATLQTCMVDAGAVLGNDGGLDDDSLSVPGGETYVEGEDSCEGADGDPIVQVAIWQDVASASNGDDPAIVTENFDNIRFASDGQAYTIAFAPEGAEIPPPSTVDDVAGVSPDLGVPEDEVPAEAEQPGAGDPAGDEPAGDEPAGDEPAGEEPATDDETDATEPDADS